MARATLFEEHAEVLPHWFGLGLRGATLVSLDAHLDLQFIEERRIARLRAAAEPAAMAALACPHPLAAGRGCFGIEDFLYAAGRLDLVRRLVWVAPPQVLESGMGAALGSLQQMEGVTKEQLGSFLRTPGGWIEGRLLGLEIVIGELGQLEGMPLEAPVLVDIDADYFVAVPEDRIWTPPAEVVAALKRWLGPGADLTIARSVGTGFLPLRHRFLADQLAALWEERGDEARHWQAVLDAELDPASAPEILRAEALKRPDCAATAHALALATRDAALLQQAAALDPHYADDLVRRLGEYRARWKRLDLATVRRLQREVAGFQDTPERMAIAWTALGLLHVAFGDLSQAEACDAQALRHGPGHPELALEIAKLLLAAGRLAEATPWLHRAAADDETRVAAWFQLSRCAASAGELESALRWATQAQAAAPAWMQLQQWRQQLQADPNRYDQALSARSSVG